MEEKKRGRSGDRRRGEDGYLLVLGLIVRGREAIRSDQIDTHKTRVDKAS